MMRRCWPSGARGRSNWQVQAHGGAGHATGMMRASEPMVHGVATWREWMEPVRPRPMVDVASAQASQHSDDSSGKE